MSNIKSQKIISCIGISYIQPILDLYEILDRMKFSGKSEFQVSSYENGYSVAIILLCACCIESIINRIRYLDKEITTKKEHCISYFQRKFNDISLSRNLWELFILRDIIAHSHLWEMKVGCTKDLKENLLKIEKLEGYGDKKFFKNININRKQTKILRLNIIPIKIGKEDVRKVLAVFKSFLYFVENKNKSYLPISHFYFKYNEKMLPLDNIIKRIIGEDKNL